MCYMAIAYVAVAALSAAASVNAQNQQVKSQNRANDVQRENILTSSRANLANLETVRQQNAADTTEKINRNNQSLRQATSTAEASAGEANVSGTSIGSLLRDLAGQAGYDNTNVETNYLRQDQAINVQRENAANLTNSQINSLRIAAPIDYAGAAATVAGGALNGYSAQQQSNARTDARKIQ